MKELILIAVGSAIVNNVVLSQFLGICPFLGVSKKTETAAGMGGAVVFVITISSFVTGLIYKYILANEYLLSKGIDLTYLQTIVFILVRDVLKEIHASFIQELGCVLTTDHNKLCCIRCCTYKRYQRI